MSSSSSSSVRSSASPTAAAEVLGPSAVDLSFT